MMHSQIYEDGQEDDEEEEEEDEEEDEEDDESESVDTPSQTQPDHGDEEHLQFYNPNQDPEQRRRLRANMRDHYRLLDGKWCDNHQYRHD